MWAQCELTSRAMFSRRCALMCLAASVCVFIILASSVLKSPRSYQLHNSKTEPLQNHEKDPFQIHEQNPLLTRAQPQEGSRFITWPEHKNLGIGNHLFAFAALLGLGRYHQMTPVLSSNSKITTIFKLESFIDDQKFEQINNNGSVVKERRRFDCRFDKTMFEKFQSDYVILSGYFQSWMYFVNITFYLRETLVFKEEILEESRLLLLSLNVPLTLKRGGDKLLIGIHIRRGDILEMRRKKSGYTTAPPSYFHKAIEFFHQKFKTAALHFIVLSNDHLWAQRNLQGVDPNLYFSVGHSASVDLAVMSLCDHMILSTGSFGWWGAWLANGTTVYYSNWPREGSSLSRIVNKNEYFPLGWIKL